MEYRFRISRRELLEFSLFAAVQNMDKLKTGICMIMSWGMLVSLGYLARPALRGLWLLLTLPAALCLPWIFSARNTYLLNRRGLLAEDTVLRLEDGMVKHRCGGYQEIPACDVRPARGTSGLLLLTYLGLGNRTAYILLPRRVLKETGEDGLVRELELQGQAGLRRREEEQYQQKAQQEAPPDIRYTFPVNPELLAHMTAAKAAAEIYVRRSDEKGALPGILRTLLWAVALWFFFGWKGILLTAAGTVMAAAVKMTSRTEGNYRALINAGREYRQSLGQWSVLFYLEGIRLQVNQQEQRLGWSGLDILLLSGDVYILCYRTGTSMIMVPRQLFYSQHEEEMFRQYCIGRGAAPVLCPVKISGHYKRYSRLAAAAVIFLVMVLVWPVPGAGGRRETPAVIENYDAAGEFLFVPSDYPEYMPLEGQRAVLEGLGFTVPQELMGELKEILETDEYAGVYVEGYPFCYLLTCLGYPEHDEDTLEAVRFSDQVYWMDWESYYLEQDYVDLLRAAEHLSGGDLSMEEITVDTDRVNWERGTGSLRLEFTLNGRHYRMKLRVMGDWLDTSVIQKLNLILKKEGVSKRIYYCGDNGQGALLFYRDTEWAEEFTRKTGLPLERK